MPGNPPQGEREIPDHPLVDQTLADCLTEVMDVGGLERLLARIESGAVEVIARDLASPSPLAEEVIGAHPYAFLDDTPRRGTAHPGRSYPDALLLAGFLTWDELGAGAGFVTRLAAKRRAVRLEIPDGAVILCATERLPELAAAVPPSGSMDPTIVAGIPSSIPFPTDRDHALRELVRSRLECLGPIRATDLARAP